MIFWKSVVLSAIAFAVLGSVNPVRSQISVGVNVGVAPVCPYGYFDYVPYDCAPYGYYGPDWLLAAYLSVSDRGSMACGFPWPRG